MEVKQKQIFNLWDTNGRRKDVINAIEIYLHQLQDLHAQYPNEEWASYPKSILQYLFYKSAIESSPDILQHHDHFDNFEQDILNKYDEFIKKNLSLSVQLRSNLDKNIEQRARHYTSNLVTLGLTNNKRIISPAGNDLLKENVKRDKLEEILPITDTNLILFRQLLKLKVYTKPDSSGKRYFYSPCLYALYLLISRESVEKDFFKKQVQGISPYWYKQINLDDILKTDIVQLIDHDIDIPVSFRSTGKISQSDFGSHVKNRKSSKTVPIYYTFYSALYDYVQDPNNENYIALRNILLGNDKSKIEKAFGYGSNILKCGNKAHPFTKEKFIEENKDNILLTTDINIEIYKQYCISKYLDTAREYSDTTIRMLGATGLFQFSKPLIELSHKEFFNVILSHYNLKQSILGEVTEEQYERWESLYYKSSPVSSILDFDNSTIDDIVSDLRNKYGSCTDIRSVLIEENKVKLETHIQEKYPPKKIVELLRLLANRNNDNTIKQYVNEDATVPTIFEYIVAIAWYYISSKKISVYDSLNLTLNGDLEPVLHAGGGAGDIVVKYSDKIVMLEVTLMNAAAQKRGEWEPVLRHAINLTSESYPQKVFTIFVADTLDYNTINIWRAVAAVTLESSSTGEKTEHVVIMPFTNEHLCSFIEKKVSDDTIINEIEKSYDEIKANFDDSWHNKILTNLC